MESKRGEFVKLADTLINRCDTFLPWCTPKSIIEYERVYDASFDEQKNKARLRLVWALIHSVEPRDVHCGIIVLEAGLLLCPISAMRKKKLMYLLSVGYYRTGNHSKSLNLVNGCLEIAPNWWKAFALKLLIENRFNEEQVKNMLIDGANTVGVAAGLPESTTRILYATRVIEAMTFKISVEDSFKKAVATAKFHDRIRTSLEMEMYTRAIQYTWVANLSRSRLIIDCCLEIAPEYEDALNLKKTLDSKRKPTITSEKPTITFEKPTITFEKPTYKSDVYIVGIFALIYGCYMISYCRKK